MDEETLQRYILILRDGWAAFGRAAEMADGKELRTGPRLGGGRDLERIKAHVFESERAYLRKITGTFKPDPQASLEANTARLRQALEAALTAAVREGLPETGPRGGELWTARSFMRHVVWHILDHAWEIEDRVI